MLGKRLFTLLTALDVCQAHYSQLWAQLAVPVCPFCGQGDLDHSNLPAEDLDHYLSRKIYPFAAANLHNLAPMCSRCNMDYKGAKDVLSGTGGIERHYAYDTTAPGSVDLLGSQFFATATRLRRFGRSLSPPGVRRPNETEFSAYASATGAADLITDG